MDALVSFQPLLDRSVAKNAWAKFDWKTNESLSLQRHLDDVAFVAEKLWLDWLPKSSKRIIANCLGNDELLAMKLAILVAAGHDIGKHSRPFATKIEPLKERMISAGAEFGGFSDLENKNAPHGIFSAQSFMDWLHDRIQSTQRNAGSTIAVILAGHHGTFPSRNQGESEYIREQSTHWHSDRMQYWDRAAKTAGLSAKELAVLATCELSQVAQMVLCGFLIMCDWIGSNQEFFPLDDARTSRERAQSALQQLDFPAPWSPELPSSNEDLFHQSFHLPPTAKARPVQEMAMQLARTVDEPSLFVIEAPTGEGKTEAALASAEILISKHHLGGVTIALPTCATSDAMFPRITNWLGRRLPQGSVVSTILTHGKAQFNDDYTSLFRSSTARFSGIYGDEEDVAIAHWWLAGRKTAALADFTVGTIDQVLFAALRSRHLVLRHLGLSSKVVILDEVHVADSYMSIYLDRVLEWLGAMKVPVIALSATLDPKRRSELLVSYRWGAAKANGQRYIRADKKADCEEISAKQGYPLISVANSSGVTQTQLKPSGRENTFEISFIGEEINGSIISDTYIEGCIGIVCNTINRAQNVYQELVNVLGSNADVVLLHSRFLGFERRRIEKDLVEKLGPKSVARPKRLIVVSTQVIEQSLDIDFDLLISDICPIDLLLQRAGRLHRHPRSRPPEMATARLLIAGCTPPVDTEAPTIVKGIRKVYGESKLLRTLATIMEHGEKVHSPCDVEPLVRRAYSSNLDYPPAWEEQWTQAEDAAYLAEEKKREKAKGFLLKRPGRGAVWEADPVVEARDELRGQAQVRDIDEGLEVILIHKGELGFSTLSLSPHLPEEIINFDLELDNDLSKELAKSSISIPAWLMNQASGEVLLDYLEQEVFTAEQVGLLNRNRWLKGQLFLPLDDDYRVEIDELSFRYDVELGLLVELKREEYHS